MTDPSDEVEQDRSRRLNLRLRDCLIDYFRLFSSESRLRDVLQANQAEWGTDAQALFFNGWDDWLEFENYPEQASYPADIYSSDEYQAVCRYHEAWSDVLDAKTGPLESLDALFAMPQWPRMRDAAAQAVAVFEVRGRLGEDRKPEP